MRQDYNRHYLICILYLNELYVIQVNLSMGIDVTHQSIKSFYPGLNKLPQSTNQLGI